MTKLTSPKLVASTATSLAVLSLLSAMSTTAPRASAAPAMSSAMPLSSQWRACDFTKLPWVKAVGYARVVAHVGAAAPGVAVAAVDMATALPDTRYEVRVVQTPRPSIGCAAGASGVLTGSIQTDGAGAGGTTVAGPIAAGATGAWVIVELPSGSSQTPTQFYTTEFIASI